MPYQGDGSYSRELLREHTNGLHEEYEDPNCRRCTIRADLLDEEHLNGAHRNEEKLFCPACDTVRMEREYDAGKGRS